MKSDLLILNPFFVEFVVGQCGFFNPVFNNFDNIVNPFAYQFFRWFILWLRLNSVIFEELFALQVWKGILIVVLLWNDVKLQLLKLSALWMSLLETLRVNDDFESVNFTSLHHYLSIFRVKHLFLILQTLSMNLFLKTSRLGLLKMCFW